jgi:transcriptional regulator with XRE-family HTH domain
MASVEEQLGRRVAQHRKAAGITQAELAERVGVTTETVSRLERGAVIPPVSRLSDIADAIGVKLVDLFRFRDHDGPKDRPSRGSWASWSSGSPRTSTSSRTSPSASFETDREPFHF